ncbi:MAG: adhesin [Desulfobacteraceae bacterium]|nr:MAG: adhesin [Desulfobacteraceae bacterium]
MFNVSEEAQKQIAEYFKSNEIKPIRIFLHQGCGGAQIGMVIDEKKDADMVFKVAGIEYLVEKEFLKKARPIAVDFMGSGFRVSSSMELGGGGCGGCGSTGSCCS